MWLNKKKVCAGKKWSVIHIKATVEISECLFPVFKLVEVLPPPASFWELSKGLHFPSQQGPAAFFIGPAICTPGTLSSQGKGLAFALQRLSNVLAAGRESS
jgi:hypothetical protein